MYHSARFHFAWLKLICRQTEGETVEQIRGSWRFVDRHNEFGENGINEIEFMQEKKESVKGKYRRVEKEK